MSNICIKLDDKRHVNNWQVLGIKIGFTGKQLRGFKDPSGYSHAEIVLRKIETLKPNLLLTDMKLALKELKLVPGLSEAIANELKDFEGNFFSLVCVYLNELKLNKSRSKIQQKKKHADHFSYPRPYS